MLVSLSVRHFALVKELEIDFAPGLVSISGETGAGKSLMITALGLALGDKPKHIEDDNTNITAEFLLPHSSAAVQWLVEHNVLTQDTDILADQVTVVLRRSLVHKRSKAYINGVQVGVGELSRFGDLIVTMHSQHQHHALLERPAQRAMFDAYAQVEPVVAEVARLYAQAQRLRQDLEQATHNQEQTQRELGLMQHSLAELEALSPQQGEYPELDQRHRQYSRSHQLQQHLAQLHHQLESEGNQQGLLQQLYKTGHDLEHLELEVVHPLITHLNEAASSLEQALQEARRISEESYDPSTYQELEERIASYHQLARKHQCRPMELADVYTQMQQQCESLATKVQAPEALEQALAQCQQQLHDQAQQLRDQRLAAAAVLEKEVNAMLPNLAMKEASFRVDLKQGTSITSEGSEQPAFVLRTSSEGTLLPLKHIASGGELSRVSLALHLACKGSSSPATMVFDEVDTGLSGKVATQVGAILQTLAEHHQVLCVSHHPHLVAHANQHLSVCKQPAHQSSAIRVQSLSGDAVIVEIARMLGGESEAQLQLAREMYHNAHQ